ncbi:MAG: polymer-forming cytoskeletal protein, partial [Acidobacteria bacterium]|nr:polymer-forming cytoskeletal protein [Acidobacteriota bacterium]
MWKRDDVVRPPDDSADVEEHPLAGLASAGGSRRPSGGDRPASRDVVNIGKSVIIKGELSGSENLTIEGQFEGKIELRDNALTVGPNGKIKAELLFAKSVDILGRVTGK